MLETVIMWVVLVGVWYGNRKFAPWADRKLETHKWRNGRHWYHE